MGILFTSKKEKAIVELNDLKEDYENILKKIISVPLNTLIESKHGFTLCPVCYDEFKDIEDLIAHVNKNKKEFELIKNANLDIELVEGKNKLDNFMLVLYVCGYDLITFVNNNITQDLYKKKLEEIKSKKDEIIDIIQDEVTRYKLLEEMEKRKHENWKNEIKNGEKTDQNGYHRGELKHSDLIHRQIAYKEIYLKNREDYPMPFEKYIVHHKDGNKKNNEVSNLQILTKEEHESIHKKY